MQDRKRLLSLPICPDIHSNLPPLPPNPPSGAAPIIISNSSINNNANSGASCSGSLKVKMVNSNAFVIRFAYFSIIKILIVN